MSGRVSAAGIMLLAAIAAVPARAGLYEKGGALGLGARAMGLGGAYTAAVEDATAVWWNPAGLAALDTPDFHSSFGSLYNGRIMAITLSAGMPLPAGAAAGAIFQHDVFPGAAPISAETVSLAGCLPLSPDRRLVLGAGLKFLFGRIEASGGTYQGTGVDVGLRYGLPFNDEGRRLVLGARVQDLDTHIAWEDGFTERVPQSFALGGAFHLDRETLFALDVERIHSGQEEGEDTGVLRLGAERWIQETFGLRAGWLVDDRRTGAFTAGAGLRVENWSVEYGLIGPVERLGFSHRLSVRYGLPPAAPRAEEPVLAEIEPLPSPEPVPDRYELALTAEPRRFSPNGDGVADTVVFVPDLRSGRTGGVAAWRLSLEDADGDIVRFLQGDGFPGAPRWDGLDQKGEPVPDGVYRARMMLADARDTRLAHAEVSVRLVTRLPAIGLEPEAGTLWLLNGRPAAPLGFAVRGAGNLTEMVWRFDVYDARGTRVGGRRGRGDVPARVTWSGVPAAGGTSPAGAYTAVFRIEDTAGNRTEARAGFRIRAIRPRVDLSVRPKVFSPADPAQGTVTFALQARDGEAASSWELTLRGVDTERVVRRFRGRGAPPAARTWQGRTDAGRAVRPGRYFLARLKVTYPGGKVFTSPPRGVATDIDLEGTSRALTLHLTVVRFEPRSNSIPLPSFDKLNRAVETVTRYAKRYRVHVLGYTDAREAGEKDLELARARAGRVRKYLVEQGGLPAERVKIVGYGAARPLADNETREGRAKNRRAEVVLIIVK